MGQIVLFGLAAWAVLAGAWWLGMLALLAAILSFAWVVGSFVALDRAVIGREYVPTQEAWSCFWSLAAFGVALLVLF